ncbi:S1C family serine protease [Alicyclobacillus dauci]|uniref:Trypsin-like peptidase domain-containing protein n=1 Tax=Alicyclobacillus dauci TaxID=1475485 RepID=A0ABY6Z3Z1_9BACL|nr:trypsin-like peptidase domain-containing protein [Alicyclobacillus dauci]WAH37602.1 trypsin-like peptidase domain-containing protein [Alicyclobacillus dauci]
MDRSESSRTTQRNDNKRWIAVAALSACIGAGVTLAMTPLIRSGTTAPNTVQTTPPVTGTSAPMSSNVNVNISDAITNVFKTVSPDVVAVVNYTTSNGGYFGQSQQPQQSDIGSGVYFNKDSQYAYIVTNNHVVEGGSKVDIVLKSNKQVQAQVVGTDPYTDLAVLKVPVSNFNGTSPAPFANSDKITIGEPVVAIGTPMGLDFAETVTSGIVSGNQRMMPVEEPTSQTTLAYESVIQTDAAINPGNSGGPLLNINGQVIGINSSKIVAQNFQGMGFAIPSNEVENIASQIMKTGHAIHPALGISGLDLSTIPQGYLPNVPVDYGIYVQNVLTADAKAGGLQQGDVIIAVNGQTVQSTADLRTALFKLQPGQTVKVTVYRGSAKKTLQVKVGQQQSVNTTDNSQGDNSGGNDFGGGSGGLDPFSGGGSIFGG